VEIASGDDVGRERESIERKERNEMKKKEGWSNRYRDKGASLVVTLLCHKGASEVGVLPVDMA
jgi:hypothetical protein